MQLSLAFPSAPPSVNNRTMAGKDGSDADKLDAAKKLRNKALRLLTTREHSRDELLRKLAQAKARRARIDAQAPAPERDEIERVVDELAAQGWQSDERYAEAIVRRLSGQASRRYIEDKLASAGIKKEAAREALEALDADDMAVATALWQRRFGEAPGDDKQRQKQIRFLLSRGFHLGDAFKIVPRAAVDAASSRESSHRVRTAARGVAASRDRVVDADVTTDTQAFDESGVDVNERERGGSAAAAGDQREAEAPAELQYSRTSDTRRAAGAPDAGESAGTQLRRSSFQRKVKRARPWGARNDTDPSDS